MEARRDIFQAIADPTRRAILLLLAAGSLTPNSIAEQFDCSRQAVSKHLQVLVACELLHADSQGREMHYRLRPEKLAELDQWLMQFKSLLSQRFDQLDTVLAQMKKDRA